MAPSTTQLLSSLLLATIPFVSANTRQADPGFTNDTLCTFAVLELIPKSNLLNNTLLLWPKDSCCTTTDCSLQHFRCPSNSAHAEKGGDVCCYKADGNGASAGVCKCGIDGFAQGTCF
ncbi:hypothetical protein B0A55_02832 [Friedmanniomyces simplex]|uniref:Uncharacterized protein n=1 Tax=Friedmanniomyces simplex TaxID=329884 RepID=A0A4U0XV34_9PEZI|nr:hypothetical protein B0A55_02832 [Friedmanniomyces simplex]